MLLLDPDGPYVWAVKSKTRVVRNAGGGIDIEATLTKAFVPPEWKIIDADSLARSLVTKTGAVTVAGRRLVSDPLQGGAS
jgi:hypothetical protein